MCDISPSDVFDHLMMLERTEAAAQQTLQEQRLNELQATAAALRAKRDRIRAETDAIRVCTDVMYKLLVCVFTNVRKSATFHCSALEVLLSGE